MATVPTRRMKPSSNNLKIIAIAALSFRIFSSLLLLARVGNENTAFEHEGKNQNAGFSSSNNRNLLEMRKDRPAIAINSVATTTCLKK
jgi:hypothetical protein